MIHHTSPCSAARLDRALSVTVLLIAVALPTAFAQTTIPAGSTRFDANTPGAYILNSGVTRSVPSNSSNEVIRVANSGTSGTYSVEIAGTVSQDGTGANVGRGIRTGNTGTGVNVSLTIDPTGIVRAVGDDAIQGRNVGTFNLTNLGTLYSGPSFGATPGAPLITGRGLNLRDNVGGGTIINGLTGLIRSDGGDAVRVGSNFTFTNYGTIRAAGVVNDAASNNPGYTTADDIYSAGGGFSFEDIDAAHGAANSSLDNFGSISGARHGVQAGTAGTNLTVTNELGGTIIGRNGSGVGFDTTSASASNVTVNNSGLIRGDYAGAGNVIDRRGLASPTQDGDGDGVDIDGAATIHNYSTGQILATGAGGYDSSGRANTSDGVSIGGGVITNDGLIRGASVGIVVNNDANVDRSGVAATIITNSATGTIEGQNGYAIRLENKLGDARDNDTITNAGTIIGGGAIPSPGATVTLQYGTTDTNSMGTLNGVTYTGTGSARFIRGDGAAIQMGEGNDVLNNTGTITGTNGRALSMEGGNDRVNIGGGAVNGTMDGGAGADTLKFDLGAATNTFTQNGAITNFEHVEIASGNVQLAGSLSLGADPNTLAVDSGGILNLGTGSLTMNQGSVVADGILKFLLNSSSSYGQMFFAGSDLGGLTLTGTSVLDLDFGYAPLVGQQFTLVDFLGGSPFLTGTFAGLGEGAFFVQEGYQFQISYQGNEGHDIVITRTVPDTTATLGLLAGGLVLLALARRQLSVRI